MRRETSFEEVRFGFYGCQAGVLEDILLRSSHASALVEVSAPHFHSAHPNTVVFPFACNKATETDRKERIIHRATDSTPKNSPDTS